MGLSIIILAAGQGTRMRSRLPKVLQPLAGKPLLGHVLDCARRLEADDIAVVYGHGGDTVVEAFRGQTVRWVLQAEQLGTGHAVRHAMPETPNANRVLILFGDVPLLTAATIRRLLEATAPDEVSVLTVDLEDPTGYGRILRQGEAVTGIVEHKDASAEQRRIAEINTGVMVSPAARLKHWLGRVDNDNTQGEYYLTDVVGMAVEDGIAVRGVKAQNLDRSHGNQRQETTGRGRARAAGTARR